ncbi:aminotransferase class V-fold PLP-dependent enzyme [Candidatus Saccharibacteria bacterium]|nr:aminotransferase class V-fold PLP-dependent enzyme [Candidatus Saccharibacteria bacterium]
MRLGKKSAVGNNQTDFGYLAEGTVYLDSACQSLRPQPVIDALNEYYTTYNSCGERVRYAWGKKVDANVATTRSKILKLLKYSPKDYFVSFTLNTSYGINLLVNQLKVDAIKKVVTTDIEHNSVFLPTMAFAKKYHLPREVITRNADGSIDLNHDFSAALVVVNVVSNIDGRRLQNVRDLVAKVHQQGGLVILDAAQAVGHYYDWLANVPADAICSSAHKMYAPSLGVMVVKKDLPAKLDLTFLGGGMVDDVNRDSYQLSYHNPAHIHTVFESGLQAWGEIIALGAAVDWLIANHKDNQIDNLSQQLYDWLKARPNTVVLNQESTPVISFYHKKTDSHLLAEGLSEVGIMARSGYFCCHYYLSHVQHYPALVRLSLGLHNTQADVDKVKAALEGVLQ